ncbi:hypothetical protein NEOLEDRAFT_1078539, partial [Neolentinus lepideus HHB14362 ss-1]
NLLSLATELIVYVLENLDLNSLVACQRVCSDLKKIIDESVTLQYRIELAVAGMENGPPSSIDVAERLRRLQNYTKAWREMTFSPLEKEIELSGHLWELYGGVLVTSVGDTTLVFNKLPGHARGIRSQEWKIENVGFPIRDFKMDLSQYLLAMLDFPQHGGGFCTIHLRTLSTNEPHPLASYALIIVPLQTSYSTGYSFDVLICDDKVGVKFNRQLAHGPYDDVNIFHIRGRRKPIDTFTFLSDHHILLGISDERGPRLEVYDLPREARSDPEWNGQDYLCAFLYEDHGPYFVSHNILIQSNPAPSWTPLNDTEVPFFAAPGSRVLCLSYEMVSVGARDANEFPAHFIPLQVLLAFIPESPNEVGMA